MSSSFVKDIDGSSDSPPFEITLTNEKFLSLVGYENVVRLVSSSGDQVTRLSNTITSLKIKFREKSARVRALCQIEREYARQINKLKNDLKQSEVFISAYHSAYLDLKKERDDLIANKKICSFCLVQEFVAEKLVFK